MKRPVIPKSWGFGNVEVRRSGVHGHGLFAARDFRRGERIMRYAGELVGKKEGERRAMAQWRRGKVYMFDLSTRRDIDGSPLWNKARWANHSCDPNAEAQNLSGQSIWIVARRRIRKGDEVAYDYRFEMDEEPARCRCGSPHCVGYMVSRGDWRKLRKWLVEHRRKVPTALARL